MANILVVDDEPGIREFVVDTLSTDGHHLVEASSGDEAVHQLDEKPFDLLITDLRMPGSIDGMELVRETHRLHPDTRVIVLTAHGSIATAVDAMKLGAVDFLEKPVSGPVELRLIVSRALDGRGAPKEAESGEPVDVLSKQLSRALGSEYRVADVIGKGGYSMVFGVEDRHLSRSLAAKVLLPEYAASTDTAERFRHEARTMASLNHPNIMPVYFVGRDREVPFFVMPRVHGVSVAELLVRQKRLELPVVLRIARDVAAALDYAHARGVVHRDVKPANILVDAESGRAILADFGIAKAVVAGTATQTARGMFLGTPEYASPEQIGGEADVCERTDFYSFAVVTYEMLAGHPPFHDPSPSRTMALHLFEPVPPLSASVPGLSERIDAVFERALAKAPADRFASAGAFVLALEVAARSSFN